MFACDRVTAFGQSLERSEERRVGRPRRRSENALLPHQPRFLHRQILRAILATAHRTAARRVSALATSSAPRSTAVPSTRYVGGLAPGAAQIGRVYTLVRINTH